MWPLAVTAYANTSAPVEKLTGPALETVTGTCTDPLITTRDSTAIEAVARQDRALRVLRGGGGTGPVVGGTAGWIQRIDDRSARGSERDVARLGGGIETVIAGVNAIDLTQRLGVGDDPLRLS